GHHFGNAADHVVVEEINEGGFVFGRAVVLCVSGSNFLSAVGFESPGEFLGLQIDGEEPAIMRANVCEVTGNGRRREHRPVLEIDVKERSAGFCVEGMKEASVGSGKEDFALVNCG